MLLGGKGNLGGEGKVTKIDCEMSIFVSSTNNTYQSKRVFLACRGGCFQTHARGTPTYNVVVMKASRDERTMLVNLLRFYGRCYILYNISWEVLNERRVAYCDGLVFN